jgi:hypothetical protein
VGEERLLIKYYNKIPINELCSRLDRNKPGVKARARKLGIVKKASKEWSEYENNLLIEKFSTMTNKNLEKLLGRSWTSIATRARKFGLVKDSSFISNTQKKLKNGWALEEEDFLKSNFEKYSNKELALYLNRTPIAINSKLFELRLIRNRDANRLLLHKYKINHDFFKEIDTPDKAYILGFIYADGNLAYRGHSYKLRITIQYSDHDLLVKFNKCFGSDYLIRNTKQNQWSLEISSKNMFMDLNNLHIYPNKTYLDFIPIVPKEYESSFTRGLFDGDGCFSYYQNTGRVSITNSINMCNWLLTTTRRLLFVGGGVKYLCPNGHKYARWDLGGNKQVSKFVRWLYSDGSDLYLERKYKKIVESGLLEA